MNFLTELGKSFLTGQDRTPKFTGQVLPDRTKSGLIFLNILHTKYELLILLTLSGTGQGTFTLMSLLDQILSAEFFSKISKLFWR